MHFLSSIAIMATLVASDIDYQDSTAIIGKQVFGKHCYSCHKDSANGPSPSYSILTTMTANSVYAALTMGKMKAQAAVLTDVEKKAVTQ